MRLIGSAVPAAAAAVVFFFLVLCQKPLDAALESNPNAWGNLFGAVFDWSAIQTGFMFGVYGFLIGAPNGFMKAIETTSAFQLFRAGVLTSLFAGFVLTIVSLPLLVLSPEPRELHFMIRLLVYFWLSLFVFALLSFFKTAFVFAKMTSQSGSGKIPA